MTHNPKKSQFLAKETQRSEGLAVQLTTTHQEVAELTPAAREVADLQAREKDACDNAHEAEEKLVALIERVCMDAMEAERLRKERDDLLRAIKELRTGIDLARQEHVDA